MSAPAVRSARAALLGLLVATGCLPRGTLERPVVVALRVEGTRAVSEADVVPRLQTQPSSRYLFTPEPQAYDEDAAAVDRRRIEAYYRSRGYLSARVGPPEVVPRGEGRVEVRFRVEEEGPPVRVAEVRVVGLEAEPAAQARLPRLPLGPGDLFTEAGFDAGRAALLVALGAIGYPRAEVEQQAEIDPATRVVVLTGYGSIATALEAVRLGAVHYLTKPADVDDLLLAFARADAPATPMPPEPHRVPSLARTEWEHIHRVLADCGGNVTRAARLLGIHRRSLQRKLTKAPLPR